MSKPYALPVGPTRRADKRTSIPPPEPRSSTVSPGASSASAVGLPQPNDASTAAGGNSATSSTAYRSEVMGLLASAPQPQPPSAPQQALVARTGSADSVQACSWET